MENEKLLGVVINDRERQKGYLMAGYLSQPEEVIAAAIAQIHSLDEQFILQEITWTTYLMSLYQVTSIHFEAVDIVFSDEQTDVPDEHSHLAMLIDGYNSDDDNVKMAVIRDTLIRLESYDEELKNNEASWTKYLWKVREEARLNYEAMRLVITAKNDSPDN